MITVVNSSNDHGENENDGEDDQGLAKSDLKNMQLIWIGVLTWAFTPNWVRLFAATKARLGRVFSSDKQCLVGAMMHSGKRQRKCYFKPGQNMGEKDIKP